MTDNNVTEIKEKKGLNFIEQFVDNDLKAGKMEEDCKLDSRLNLMDICISVMPKPFAWILESPISLEESVIFEWMTPIQRKKTWNM